MHKVRIVQRGSAFAYDADARRETLLFAVLPKIGDRLACDRVIPWQVCNVVLLPQPQADESVAIVEVMKDVPLG